MAAPASASASLSSNSLRLRNLPLIFPQNPNSKPLTQFAIGSRNHHHQNRLLSLKLKCSFTDTDKVVVGEYPKPSEIQWKKELCNSVNLIGIVASPVEIKHFPSGTVVAWTRITVKKNATQSSWINLSFWNEMAHIAHQHLQKGNQIYVSGRLTADTVETDDGKTQTYYKVIVQQLNFIERSFSSVSSHDQDFDSTMPANSGKKVSYSANNTGSVVELWNTFFANPGEWWDNRKNKKNPKGPDFKHKDTGEALWIEGRSNPPWVKSQLAILDSRMGSNAAPNTRMPVHMINADEILSF
ncbi:hypothetical protein TanjilG_01968 [Lupinus angustifolius]|uniref:protein OSB2, chloroplastic-like n=1 Tax=Lupinus angustifolius TaxID=3871 RepID=UPI00090D314A|nr:PREDICTED: protein OSB2, chloroplastic-like [Lupinus angustifolius]OIV91350.1 hypothetical protein TanjilG_01968 [Lupinus angustifolius]